MTCEARNFAAKIRQGGNKPSVLSLAVGGTKCLVRGMREGIAISVIGTQNQPNRFNDMRHRAPAELIAEAEQAFTAAKRLVDEQTAIVRRLERTGGCNSEAVDLLNNLRELLAARERRLARVRSWPSWDYAA